MKSETDFDVWRIVVLPTQHIKGGRLSCMVCVSRVGQATEQGLKVSCRSDEERNPPFILRFVKLDARSLFLPVSMNREETRRSGNKIEPCRLNKFESQSLVTDSGYLVWSAVRVKEDAAVDVRCQAFTFDMVSLYQKWQPIIGIHGMAYTVWLDSYVKLKFSRWLATDGMS